MTGIILKLNFFCMALITSTAILATSGNVKNTQNTQTAQTTQITKTTQSDEINEGFNNLNTLIYSSAGIGTIGVTGSLIIVHNKKKRRMNEPSNKADIKVRG